MKFTTPNLNDLKIYDKFFHQENNFSYHNTPVTMFLWKNFIDYSVYFNKDFLVLKIFKNIFYLPFGNIKLGLEAIDKYCENNNIEPIFIVTEGQDLSLLESENTIIKENRNAFQYLYNSSDLAELKGRKYHSKRNHISAFKKQYEYTYEDLCESNIPDVLNAANIWYHEHEKTKETAAELEGIKFILENKEKLNVFGALIRISGVVAAFSIASEINEVAVDIHIEKAINKYKSAYALINNEFAKKLNLKYKFINREDDLGVEGLRKAKLSYKPCKILKSYEIKRK